MNSVAEKMELARRYGPANNISRSDARRLSQLVDAKAGATGEAAHALGLATVRYLKSIPGWRSPLQWFSKTNMRHSWVIVSYHHPAQLCWEWSLSASAGKATRLRSWNPRNWCRIDARNSYIGIPWLFQISLHRQSYGWMLSSNGENLIRFTAQALERVDGEGGVK